ncbi:hypothetical protein M3Y98_00425000 [Aphelenchoides besseyi]|nr:hypothetical protein M3Y98_00425000 [Aphelenchoides besseyi]KAI6202182.1 hypothetical protein M3Y96_00921400 [Aphelenchoides besseyi]
MTSAYDKVTSSTGTEIVVSSTITTTNISFFILPTCDPDHISQTFLLVAEILIGFVTVLLNCLATISTYYALPLALEHRQSLGAISLNYAFIAGVLLARASFLVFTVFTTCNSTVSTANCKLQEFPLVFVYMMAAILPILLGLQFLRRQNESLKRITWFNACNVHQIFVAICSMFVALFFTGFDEELQEKYLRHCTIIRAIHQKGMTFSLLALLIGFHAFTLFVWQVVVRIRGPSRDDYSIADIGSQLCTETVAWVFMLMVSGFLSVYEYVSAEVDDQLINFAYETTLVVCPLILSFVRSILLLWTVVPVRFAAIRVFPLSSHFLHFDY